MFFLLRRSPACLNLKWKSFSFGVSATRCVIRMFEWKPCVNSKARGSFFHTSNSWRTNVVGILSVIRNTLSVYGPILVCFVKTYVQRFNEAIRRLKWLSTRRSPLEPWALLRSIACLEAKYVFQNWLSRAQNSLDVFAKELLTLTGIIIIWKAF